MTDSKASALSSDPPVYAYQIALALLATLLLGLPVPLMLLRGILGFPILHRNIGASEPLPAQVTAVPAGDLYGRWQRKAKVITDQAHEFQETFSKSFGGRETWRNVHSLLMVQGFHLSPASQVIIGKEGWLFYTGDNALEGYRGLSPFSEAELARLASTLESKSKMLQSRNIPYLLVLPPDKQTIYYESMPSEYTRIGPGRLVQVASYLRQHSNVDFVDLTSPLARSREKEPLYFRRDTHWNFQGAFIGYSEIAAHLTRQFPNLHTYKRSDFREEASTFANPDLAVMMGQQKPYDSVVYFSLNNTDSKRYNQPEFAPPNLEHFGGQVTSTYPTGEIKRAVIFHDSYSQTLSQFLYRHFQHAVWVWGEFDPALILREKPDIVIEERVERRLQHWVRP